MIYGGEDCSEVDKVVASIASTDSSFTKSEGSVVGTIEIIELTKTTLDIGIAEDEIMTLELSYIKQ